MQLQIGYSPECFICFGTYDSVIAGFFQRFARQCESRTPIGIGAFAFQCPEAIAFFTVDQVFNAIQSIGNKIRVKSRADDWVIWMGPERDWYSQRVAQ